MVWLVDTCFLSYLDLSHSILYASLLHEYLARSLIRWFHDQKLTHYTHTTQSLHTHTYSTYLQCTHIAKVLFCFLYTLIFGELFEKTSCVCNGDMNSLSDRAQSSEPSAVPLVLLKYNFLIHVTNTYDCR